MKKIRIILIVIGVLALAAVIFWAGYNSIKNKKEAERIKQGIEKTTELQDKTTDAIKNAATNPGENIQSVNPYEKVANPYRDAYKNPFSK